MSDVTSIKHPKILLLGDYSNCHRTLAVGLRRLGCDVTVASNGSSWMKTPRDIDISRKPGKLGGLLFFFKMQWLLRTKLSGFDIVAIHDPHFCELKPKRLRKLFDILRAHNRTVFLTAMSTDIAFLDMLEAKDSPLRYSEWFVDGKPSRMYAANPGKWEEWHSKDLVEYQNYVFDHLDGAVSVLYEYHVGMMRKLGSSKAAYAGLPIDTSRYQAVKLPRNIEKFKLFLGRDRNRKLMKGSDLLEEAARRVVEKYPGKAELTIVENIPFEEFKVKLKEAHVVLDQIYSYTPATTALMAMAYGLNVVSGAEPEFYSLIDEKENHPVINAPIELEPLTKTIENIVLHPELIAERGKKSREFVLKHNDCVTVAKRFLEFWTSKLK